MDEGPVDDVLEELEESHRDRVEDRKDVVEDVLGHRESIYDEVTEELDEEIERQKSLLESAANSPDDEREARIRGRLEELYRERREELRAYWRDRESWVEEKMELEEEVAQIEEFEEFFEP